GGHRASGGAHGAVHLLGGYRAVQELQDGPRRAAGGQGPQVDLQPVRRLAGDARRVFRQPGRDWQEDGSLPEARALQRRHRVHRPWRVHGEAAPAAGVRVRHRRVVHRRGHRHARLRGGQHQGGHPVGQYARRQQGADGHHHFRHHPTLHFYNLSSSLSQPQMLVVADLEDVFVPLPDDVLVPIQEQRVVDTGSARRPAADVPGHEGERVVHGLRGAGGVRRHEAHRREAPGLRRLHPQRGAAAAQVHARQPEAAGDREGPVELLRPVSDGYKDLSTELTRAQVSVELFLAPQAYVDLASIAPLAKFTGGDVRYYPGFQLATSGVKLRKELYHVLTRYMGWEAVMRIRVSRGWKITKFYGHLFIRGQDLLVVPNCHADQTFAVSIDVDAEQTPEPVCCLQSALLYTNSNGERRIRVNTWAALTTPTYTDIYGSIDVQAMITMLSHQALEHSLAVNLAEGRNKLQMLCQQVIQAGSVCPTSEALQFLPLYIMGMLKSEAFKPTNDISFDRRVYIWMRLETLCVSQLAAYYYPRMMALHNAPDSCATLDENGHCTLPEMMNLTSESMTQDGVFLLEDGDMMMMWIGANVDAAFLQGLFGIGSFGELNSDAACAIEEHLEQRSDALSSRIRNILREVRIERPLPWMQLHVIKQGEPKERRFFDSLIEDRTSGVQSTYTEFLQRPRREQARRAPDPGRHAPSAPRRP
ncbi:unnamed protein product, partial [Prorocentrum cordatum]